MQNPISYSPPSTNIKGLFFSFRNNNMDADVLFLLMCLKIESMSYGLNDGDSRREVLTALTRHLLAHFCFSSCLYPVCKVLQSLRPLT